jgi:putative transposase
MTARYGARRRQVCRTLRFPRATGYCRSRQDPQDVLRVRLRDLAAARVRYGYRRLCRLLRREGWPVNAKRVYRLYKQEAFALRRRHTRRRASGRARAHRPRVKAANEV